MAPAFIIHCSKTVVPVVHAIGHALVVLVILFPALVASILESLTQVAVDVPTVSSKTGTLSSVRHAIIVALLAKEQLRKNVSLVIKTLA